MPTFIDRHRLREVTPEQRRLMWRESHEQYREPDGAGPVCHWSDDGVVYCVLVASRLEDAKKHHRARHLSVSCMLQLCLQRMRIPLTLQDELSIRATIRNWPR